MYKFIFIICVGASLLACSSHFTVISKPISVTKENKSSAQIDSIVKPYRDSMNVSMEQYVAYADTNFTVSRPSSNLMNWVADAIFIQQTQNVRMKLPIICLLNTGGIRSSIGKGSITLGDFYKVMPFDNTVVWVEMPIEALDEIGEHIKKTGGEPISNCIVEGGKLKLNSTPEGAKTFIVITSDYLANGNDKMEFFKKGKLFNETGKLLRDVLIDHARQEGTLVSNNEIRLKK
jgi:2',3'-cyclic-nucleotide 2'-phosphodiesterase (5'-nucleotidase family)